MIKAVFVLFIFFLTPFMAFSGDIVKVKGKEFLVRADFKTNFTIGNLYQIRTKGKEEDEGRTGYGVVVEVRGGLIKCLISSGKVQKGQELVNLPPRKILVIKKSKEVAQYERKETIAEEAKVVVTKNPRRKDWSLYLAASPSSNSAGLGLGFGNKLIVGGFGEIFGKQNDELVTSGTTYGFKATYHFKKSFEDGWVFEARYGFSTYSLSGELADESEQVVFIDETVKGNMQGAGLGYLWHWKSMNFSLLARITQYSIVMNSDSALVLNVKEDFSETDATAVGALGYSF